MDSLSSLDLTARTPLSPSPASLGDAILKWYGFEKISVHYMWIAYTAFREVSIRRPSLDAVNAIIM